MKQLIELSGQHLSIRAIARKLDISRNTVRKYLRAPGLPVAKPRPRRPSKVDPFRDDVRRGLATGVENCVVLLRELRAQGYAGSYSILEDYVRPLRLGGAVTAAMGFETKPGEQAQVDLGHFAFLPPDGQPHWYWGFVMVLAWSRLLYVEFIRRADVASFVRCHLNAFEHFGGLPRTCLYDNTKVVVLGRDGHGVPHWNATFLDFRAAARLRGAPLPTVPRTDEGPRRERCEVREAQLLAGGGIRRRRGSQPPGTCLDGWRRQCPRARHHWRAPARSYAKRRTSCHGRRPSASSPSCGRSVGSVPMASWPGSAAGMGAVGLGR